MEHLSSEALCIICNYLYNHNENKIILFIREELDRRNYRIKHRMDIENVLMRCTIANGLLHSFNDQPAVSYHHYNKKIYDKYDTHPYPPSGVKQYYSHGVLHRDNGPAVIYPNGLLLYYRDGKQVNYN